jgi:folate-dependent phosphoribosylglycinamide formyltransferase PurN
MNEIFYTIGVKYVVPNQIGKRKALRFNIDSEAITYVSEEEGGTKFKGDKGKQQVEHVLMELFKNREKHRILNAGYMEVTSYRHENNVRSYGDSITIKF